jgi:hypothetical protein
MEILKRKDNENEFEYKVRLCKAKLNKELDADWSEISESLNLGISSDHLRKLSYAYKEFDDYLTTNITDVITDNDIIKEIEDKRLELQKERIKLQTSKLEWNKNLRPEGRRELFVEQVIEAKERLPLPKFNNINYKENNGEYLMCFADLHYGAEFVSENNSYSRKECKRRLDLLSSRIKNMCIEKGISKLNVSSLGDDIQGILRLTDISLNQIPVVEAVVEVSRLIATLLNEISTVTNITYRHCMASNHSQTRPITGKQDLVKEDMEVIIGNYIKDLVSDNDRIEVILSNKDYTTFKLAGQNIIQMHGHQCRRGIKNIIKDYSSLHREFYDIALIGHLHAGNQMSVGESGNGNTEVIIVPSLIGSDPYSDSLMCGAKGMAKLYRLEEGYGITENYTITLN